MSVLLGPSDKADDEQEEEAKARRPDPAQEGGSLTKGENEVDGCGGG